MSSQVSFVISSLCLMPCLTALFTQHLLNFSCSHLYVHFNAVCSHIYFLNVSYIMSHSLIYHLTLSCHQTWLLPYIYHLQNLSLTFMISSFHMRFTIFSIFTRRVSITGLHNTDVVKTLWTAKLTRYRWVMFCDTKGVFSSRVKTFQEARRRMF